MVFDDARNHNLEGPTRSVLALVGLFAACFGPALVGSSFTAPSMLKWCESLSKPFFTPPSWLFGPVWTALYLAIAFAGFWCSGPRASPRP